MFGEDSGDVVVDYYDFINFSVPLFGEHADGGRAAAHSHAFFLVAIDHRGQARLHDYGCAAIDRQLNGPFLAEIEKRLASDSAFLAAASGEVANPAEREHLRTVFAGGDVAYGLALCANGVGFRAEVAVGIDLYLHAAVAEDCLLYTSPSPRDS